VEFADVVRRRKMVRTYVDRPVETALVARILAAAHRAPSAGFSQGFEFMLFENEDARRFWDVMMPKDPPVQMPDLVKAPVVIVPVARRDVYLDRYAEEDKGWSDRAESRWPIPYWIVDAAFASMLALLAAVDAGLGALFFGIGDQAEVNRFKEVFGLPERVDPIGAIAIGHAAPVDPVKSSAGSRARKPLDSIVHRGRW
jgi:nitroreductase